MVSNSFSVLVITLLSLCISLQLASVGAELQPDRLRKYRYGSQLPLLSTISSSGVGGGGGGGGGGGSGSGIGSSDSPTTQPPLSTSTTTTTTSSSSTTTTLAPTTNVNSTASQLAPSTYSYLLTPPTTTDNPPQTLASLPARPPTQPAARSSSSSGQQQTLSWPTSNSNNDDFDEFLLEPTVSPAPQLINNNNRNSGNGTKRISPYNNNNISNNQSSQRNNNNFSDIHPLLIYSIRYEIRSFDLFGPQVPIRQQQSSYLGNHSPISQSSTYYSTNYNEQNLFNGRHSKTLIAGLKNTIGLDFYYSETESFIFWTDVIEERIYRGTIINGTITNAEVVVQTGLTTAEGLAIDWIGHNIYWVESTLDHIEVAKMNGSSRRTLIAGDMESPRAIAVDPRYGLLFWTDWDKKSPRIERATMSGEDRKTLIYIKDVNGGWPNGLTLDYQYLRIYWIDANSDSIHAVDYDGFNHQPLLKHSKSLGHPFSITLFDNNLYWTDWKTNSVSMANKHNGSDARELQRLTSRLFDIKVFHPSRQPRIDNSLNPCYINNGNCSHLCLLSVNYTRKCECPPLMKLAQDNRTCVTDERVLLIGRTNEIRVVDISEPLHHVMAPISVPKVFSPRQFEYDAKSRTIFWVDSQTNEVKRAQLAGNNIETIIDVIIESPSGLALDWISGNIYVTSASQHKSPGKIFISNLNGEFISILMDGSQGIVSPKSLAVHPILGLLFCVDEIDHPEFGGPIIFAASMDGKNKRIIASKQIDELLENPSNLAIDYELNRVYWVNQASSSNGNASIQYYDLMLDKIFTILDERETLPEERINPSVLCVDGDFLVVSGRIPTEAIMRISKENITQRAILKTQNLDQLSALRVYNASSQIGTNACSQNNGNCSQLCLPTNSTHRVCKCTMGYSNNPSNETDCSGKDLFLILSYNLGMKGISLKPNSSPDDYYLPPIHRAFRASSIDYVYRDNLIYWVDNEEGSITRINRDTTNHQVIIQGLESEESIGLDWVAGNIYWLDPYYDTIEVAHLNGSNRCVIVSGDMDKANGIVVNPIKGYIVWSDIGSIPKIETALMDGTNRRVIVGTNLTHIDDLAIDFMEDYIYWVDSTLSLIERVRDDGTDRQVIYSGSLANQHPQTHHLVSIALYKNFLYIADSMQHQGSIIRLDKNTASNRTIIQQQMGEGIRDLTVFAEQPMPTPEENPCVKNNGGCQNLCIFMGETGRKRCLCSHGKLNEDGRTCKPYDTFVLFSKLSQIDTLHIKDDESFSNSPYPPIVIENRNSIISLSVDYDAQRVIYSEITRDQICSVLFNGTDRRVLVEKQSLVEGIAFANDQLYWTSVHGNSISRLNTSSLGVPTRTCDSNGCKVATVEKIIELTIDDKPRGIAVDVCTSYVYWTNWNTNASIQRASPKHGYKIESIIKTNIKVPNGIAIDQKQRKLYWCDARLDKIETCDMDGNNRIILAAASPQHPFALTIWEDYVFWTDWIARGVFKADKYTGQNPVQIKKVIQRPMGIVVAASEEIECLADLCSVNNGDCPPGYACIMHYSSSLATNTVECRLQTEIVHEKVGFSTPLCARHSRNGLCEHMSYHDIIKDVVDRYNISRTTQLFSDPAPSGVPYEHIIETFTNSTTLPIGLQAAPNGSTEQQQQQVSSTAAITTQTDTTNATYTYTQTPISSTPKATSSPQTTHNVQEPNSEITTPTYHDELTSVNPPLVNRSTLLPSTSGAITPKSSISMASITTATRKAQYDNQQQVSTSTTTNISPIASPSPSPPPPTQSPLTNSTAPPCQIVSAALQPTTTTTDASLSNECKQSGEFKCYLSDKLVCIPGDRRCDGNHDCPSKEDENDCYLSKRGPYNLKRETNWHRFVTVILIILAAAVAALFLVFGTKGRRRWFVGTNGAFNHRRMFDDNGTNIEISNPMFDEDDSGNLVHCAFSIDLNERTTNFSNPLYERQVLLMNDKHVTSN